MTLIPGNTCIYIPVEWLVRAGDRQSKARANNPACTGLTHLSLKLPSNYPGSG